MTDHLLIFDCDGVLVDSELISLGLLIDHCADHALPLDLKMACEAFLGKPVGDATKEANRIHGTSIPEVDLYAFQRKVLKQFETDLCPVPKITDALESLKQSKCVASSSNIDRIRASLRITGIERFFESNLFSTDMVARGKPHPDVFLYAATKMGFLPSKSLVIEDSPAGITAAKAADMRTIAFAGGNHAPYADLKRALSALSPDVLIDDMADLPEAIYQLSGE